MRSILTIALFATACGEESTVRKAPFSPAVGTPSGSIGGGTPAGTPWDTATSGTPAGQTTGPCAAGMVYIDDLGGYCIDRYEAGLDGWSPYDVAEGGHAATVGLGQVPQGYISGDVAAEACALAGKRLCALDEWMRACQGASGNLYPYGDVEDPSACNTTRGVHPVIELFGSAADWSPTQMNDPQLNQLPDSLDASGDNPGCVSEDGVYDLNGNLHEWIDDPAGTFKGGFYMDSVINGPGCTYTTTAHTTTYHDYSTGFRCCSDPT